MFKNWLKKMAKMGVFIYKGKMFSLEHSERLYVAISGVSGLSDIAQICTKIGDAKTL